MTWTKLGTEFFDQLVDADFPDELDDACQLTHTQAIHYCYSVEALDLRFKKSVLRRFATSTKAGPAADALVKAGVWADRGREYELLHHADVIRQSIVAQQKKRVTEKERQRRKRGSDLRSDSSGVGANVGPDVGSTQTDRQTYRQRSGGSPEQQEEHIDYTTGEVLSSAAASDLDRGQTGVQAAPPPPPAPPADTSDPWAKPSAYPFCSVPGCSERLLSALRRQSGVCFNHDQKRATA